MKAMSKADKVLELLRAASRGHTFRVRHGGEVYVRTGWVPNTALAEVGGWRYSARMMDLRKAGKAVVDVERQFDGKGKATSIFWYKPVYVRLDDHDDKQVA